MARTKKEFSKEAMYKKIMPSMLRNAEDKKDSVPFEDNIVSIVNLEDVAGKEKNKSEKGETDEKNFIVHEDDNYISAEVLAKDRYSDVQVACIQNEIIENEKDISNLNEKITVNLVEILVQNKLDNVLKRFKCCNCNSCKNDITVIALNNLPTQYFSGYKNELEEALKEFQLNNDIDVVTEIIKAVISIRKKGQHKN